MRRARGHGGGRQRLLADDDAGAIEAVPGDDVGSDRKKSFNDGDLRRLSVESLEGWHVTGHGNASAIHADVSRVNIVSVEDQGAGA